MASGELTSGAYIKHHLQNLTYGKFPDGHWGFAHSAAEAKEMGFMAVHVDTLGVSFILGALFLFFFARAAKKHLLMLPVGFKILLKVSSTLLTKMFVALSTAKILWLRHLR